jgi:hypothetical protein
MERVLGESLLNNDAVTQRWERKIFPGST